MFDNLFSASPAVWAGLFGGAIAIPILIHLINLMRHKTVKWAAMEFLLKSHKKNKNWVWLKQMLLLLSRIMALVLALLMLAQIGCQEDRIARLLGGATTHHYVLLDDSFSMAERGNSGSAFDKARATLSLIAARARNRPNQRFTLIRFSQTRQADVGPGAGGDKVSDLPMSDSSVTSLPVAQVDLAFAEQVADLNAELVDNSFDQRIEDVKSRLTVSNLPVDASSCVATVEQLIRTRTDENSIVYVLSDFREKDWKNPTAIESALSGIHSTGAAVELIRCTTAQRTNLAITSLQPTGNVRVAGTPLMMSVTVKNCSDSLVEKVQVELESFAFDEPNGNTEPTESQGEVVEIPTVFIDAIEPGEIQSRSFPVFFNKIGQHVVVARLPEDSLPVDNTRYQTVGFSAAAKVLIVTNQQTPAAEMLALAINPGNMTGITPEIRSADYLRDAAVETLQQFDVIFLIDLPTLSEAAISNLENFASRGGGVAFFVGPQTSLDFYNKSLHRTGEGIFPMPLERVTQVPELVDDRVADVVPSVHPIFAPVLGAKNSLLDLVQIKSLIRPPLEWVTAPTAGSQVLATVRGVVEWPLVVEKPFGKGRVIAFTTTAGPTWNNWMRNATFVPILLLLQDHLAAGKYQSAERLVGTQIPVDLAASEFTPSFVLVSPSGKETRIAKSTKLTVSAADRGRLTGLVGDFLPNESVRETDMPGFYDLWFRKTDSSQLVERVSLNVDTGESELALVNPQQLVTSLAASKPSVVTWDQFNPEPKQKPASSLARLLLTLLLIVLAAEQWLGYSMSYHRSG